VGPGDVPRQSSIKDLQLQTGLKAHIDAKGLSAALANRRANWRPPPDPENGSPGTVGTVTGAKVQSVLRRTTPQYCKSLASVQSAADLRVERSVFSRRYNSHFRRRYDPQRAEARPLTQSDRAISRSVEATTPTSDMVAPLIAAGANAEHGAAL
jgi:hypothetical protein